MDCLDWKPIEGRPHMGTCEKGHYGGRPSLGCCKRCDNGKNPPPPRDPKQARPQGWRPPANMDPEAQFGCKGCGN